MFPGALKQKSSHACRYKKTRLVKGDTGNMTSAQNIYNYYLKVTFEY